MPESNQRRESYAAAVLVNSEARGDLEDADVSFDSDGRLHLSSPSEARAIVRASNHLEGLAGEELWALGMLDAFYRTTFLGGGQGTGNSPGRELVERWETALGTEELRRRLRWRIERYPPPDPGSTESRIEALESDEDWRRRCAVDLVCLECLVDNPAIGEWRRRLGFEVDWEPRRLERISPRNGAGSDRLQAAIETVRRPIREAPESLVEQLQIVHERYGDRLPREHGRRILGASDLLREETRDRGPTADPPPAEPPELDETPEAEPAFSRDHEWMSSLVLLAKNTRVWLAQLSDKYGREIRHLDDIPEVELRELAERGITGLWLIGLWRRSRASRRIKRRNGREQAVASAYAIDTYDISDELGGEGAVQDLRRRASQYGIRLGADMVPNHTAIDSAWVIEHPEWFLGLEEPPFASYSFEGPDLCDDPRVEIRVEDGYWDQSDAAVVFERRDAVTGETRYIYHGNDGTGTPWNDTAQIDFLHPEARRAVYENIVDVARAFSVVRFDAAMVLAREQIRRLWHPRLGEGGAIPSRAEHGVSTETFDRAMPGEFWRKVVDAVSEEAPDTLLLAEAFWKMEGYFVRELGMHRVYNSAFMKMLAEEENADYRGLVADALRRQPGILERFVNFLTNPDEKTALEQFGAGDKYVGVCTLMATMPGTPMFGHGQIEGYAERYAMDFARPRRDEEPDEELLVRHQREIVPLLERRDAYAGAGPFELLKFEGEAGCSDAIFAYTNGTGDDQVVVVYNNSADACEGVVKGELAGNRSFADVLDVAGSGGPVIEFRDWHGDRGYRRPLDQLEEFGLSVSLEGYDCRVFGEFRAVDAEESADDGEGESRRSARLSEPAVDRVADVILALSNHMDVSGPADAMVSRLATRIGRLGGSVSDDDALERVERRVRAALELCETIAAGRDDVRRTFEMCGGCPGPEPAVPLLTAARVTAPCVMASGGESMVVAEAVAEAACERGFDERRVRTLEACGRAVADIDWRAFQSGGPTDVARHLADILDEYDSLRGTVGDDLLVTTIVHCIALEKMTVANADRGAALAVARAAAVGVRLCRMWQLE